MREDAKRIMLEYEHYASKRVRHFPNMMARIANNNNDEFKINLLKKLLGEEEPQSGRGSEVGWKRQLAI